MIPKLIHYCWFGGNPLPEQVQRYIAGWKIYCPGYEIRQWDESNFDVFQNFYCREAYESRKWAFVSDYARLKILYDCGGIYMDTDVELVGGLDEFMEYQAFTGFQTQESIPTGIMGSERNSEWIAWLLKDYEGRHFINEDGSFDLTTNVARITKLTQEKYSIRLDNTRQMFGDHMVLLPADYLCAKSWETGEIQRTSNTVAIHHFAGSWLSPEDKCYLEQMRKWKSQWPFLVGSKAGSVVFKAAAAYRAGGMQMVIRKYRERMLE